eukprot:2295306-Prymnesium_polylepis.1
MPATAMPTTAMPTTAMPATIPTLPAMPTTMHAAPYPAAPNGLRDKEIVSDLCKIIERQSKEIASLQRGSPGSSAPVAVAEAADGTARYAVPNGAPDAETALAFAAEQPAEPPRQMH